MAFWFWIAGAAVVGIVGWALSGSSNSPSSPSPSTHIASLGEEQCERAPLQQQYLERQIENLCELLRRRDQQQRQELQRLTGHCERCQLWPFLPLTIGLGIIELLAASWVVRYAWRRWRRRGNKND